MPKLSKEDKKKMKKSLNEARSKFTPILLKIKVTKDHKAIFFSKDPCPVNQEGCCHYCKHFKGYVPHAVLRPSSTLEGFCDCPKVIVHASVTVKDGTIVDNPILDQANMMDKPKLPPAELVFGAPNPPSKES